MKIAMAQISTVASMDENAAKAAEYVKKARGADIILFPEAQLTPFFPQYRERDVRQVLGVSKEELAVSLGDKRVKAILNAAEQTGIYCSPNFYVKEGDRYYDMSLLVDDRGRIVEKSRMVHILNAPKFYEKDYYTPSEDGFKVADTPFGKVGIVICFDRHLPESIRTCALKGASLILIPTVNTKSEPLEMFEWELRVQAYQNNVFIAMCNKVGKEGEMDFAGESIVIDSDGKVVVRADDREGLITADIDLAECVASRAERPYITLCRPEMYR